MEAVAQLGIFGPGLLGASVARAARHAGAAKRIVIWGRRSEAVEDMVRRGWADQGTTSATEAAWGSDLIILATPVGAMGDLAKKIATVEAPEGGVVTDVGSVKGCVQQAVGGALAGSAWAFVGSHPMAGSEKTGLEYATSDLFKKAACFVMRHEDQPKAQQRVEDFWRALGGRIINSDPVEHDSWVSAISHLPHTAASLVTIAALREQPAFAKAAAGGFFDTTRVAGGDPAMWTEILMQNRQSVVASLRRLQLECAQVLDFLEKGDESSLFQFLAEAKQLRDGSAQVPRE